VCACVFRVNKCNAKGETEIATSEETGITSEMAKSAVKRGNCIKN